MINLNKMNDPHPDYKSHQNNLFFFLKKAHCYHFKG